MEIASCQEFEGHQEERGAAYRWKLPVARSLSDSRRRGGQHIDGNCQLPGVCVTAEEFQKQQRSLCDSRGICVTAGGICLIAGGVCVTA
jgi:hypothetical protein